MNKRIVNKINRSKQPLFSIYSITTKRQWAMVMAYSGAQFFYNVWGKPIAPTLKRWRRLRKLLRRMYE